MSKKKVFKSKKEALEYLSKDVVESMQSQVREDIKDLDHIKGIIPIYVELMSEDEIEEYLLNQVEGVTFTIEGKVEYEE